MMQTTRCRRTSKAPKRRMTTKTKRGSQMMKTTRMAKKKVVKVDKKNKKFVFFVKNLKTTQEINFM